jgi:hypothetical protein
MLDAALAGRRFLLLVAGAFLMGVCATLVTAVLPA